MIRLAAPVRALDVLFIGGWFIISRVWLASIGVQPDPTLVSRLWQVLPLELLQAHPIESVWYLHSQPPLYNLAIGAALQLSGDLVWLRLLYWEIGVALVLALFTALRAVGMPRAGAHALVLLFSVNPTPALYENFLLYTYPEAFLVLAAMVALLRRPWSPATYGVTSSALVASRALFQPVWAAAAAWAIHRTAPRTSGHNMIGVWVLAPVVVGMLLVVKNGVMFDVWSTSSWYGHNVARLPYTALVDEKDRLVAAGIVSPSFGLGPFHPVDAYPRELVEQGVASARERYGAPPALFHEPKDNGHPNMNHAGYVTVSKQLAKDTAGAVLARPAPMLDVAWRGFTLFLSPASDTLFLADNRARLSQLETLALTMVYPRGSRLLVELWLALGIVTSAWLWLRPPARGLELRAAAAFVCVTTLWVMATGNLTEFGENNRFRFTLDPLLFAWNSAVLWWLISSSGGDASAPAGSTE